MRRVLLFCAISVAATAVASATQDSAQPVPTPTGTAAPAQEGPTPTAPHEVVVVTPCHDCSTRVVNSPAAVSVVSAAAIAAAPDRSFPELLRAVPGLHVVRYSTREYEVTSRQATSNLSNSQLTLVDGRSVYLDFMGLIVWDMITTDPGDVDQIEVVRGPASAIWGANALTGVVNVITRVPRDAPGSTLSLEAASFDREAGSTIGHGPGLQYGFRTSLARVLSPTMSARVSAGYSTSDPLPRPVGRLPRIPHPLAPDDEPVGGGLLPEDENGPGTFQNRGTTQPKADFRLDQQLARGRLSYSAGIAGSDGLVYTGIGPFALEPGSYLGYGRVAYSRGRFSLGAFVNLFDAKAPNLLRYQEAGEPVRLDVRSQSYDVSSGYTRPLGSRSVLTVGGNLRLNAFDIGLAPAATDRTEVGAYVQDEIFLGTDEGAQWRLALGARVDKFGNIDHAVFSPRVSLMWKPGPDHSIRLSFNRAFRAPSVVNNYLEQYFLVPMDTTAPGAPAAIPGLPPDYQLPVRGIGDTSLREESLTAWEIGYIGTFSGRTTLGANVYRNDTRDNIDFAELHPPDFYSAAHPPENWPVSPALIPPDTLPHTVQQFQNLGPIRRWGVEAFVEHRFPDGVTGYANYTWQPNPAALPSATPYPAREITIAPRNRVNAGVRWDGRRLMGSLGLAYADAAFWTDVLPPFYDGWSPAYTMFNASLGLRWADGRVLTLLRGTNLTNAEVRQHVYGDIVKRAVWAEARFAF